MAKQDPVRWQRVKELLRQAMELKLDERSAFLADACGGDATLRTDVESLLRHDGKARETQFLDNNPWLTLSTTTAHKVINQWNRSLAKMRGGVRVRKS